MDPTARQRCDLCGRVDTGDAVEPRGAGSDWLLVEVSRVSPHDDAVNETVELVFCGQPHAAAYLAERDLSWPAPDPGDDTTSGAWAGRLFLLVGLVAIVLSVVGAVAIVRWLF